MGCRARVYAIVFESDTLAGQIFDLVLLMSVLTSTMLVMLESVHHENRQHRAMLKVVQTGADGGYRVQYQPVPSSCERAPDTELPSLRAGADFAGAVGTQDACASVDLVHRGCVVCKRQGHDADAVHCKFCGSVLDARLLPGLN